MKAKLVTRDGFERYLEVPDRIREISIPIAPPEYMRLVDAEFPRPIKHKVFRYTTYIEPLKDYPFTPFIAVFVEV